MLPASRVAAAVGCVATLAVSILTLRDYRQWRSLGDGGLPANPFGYLIVSSLRVIKREPFSARLYEKMPRQPFDGSWITELPQRSGSRPSIDPHPIPQRQLDQHGQRTMVAETQRLFDSVVAADEGLRYAPSGFETRHDAITLGTTNIHHRVARRAKGEVAHVHPSDGSMHMTFSPADAITVLNAGWGERHALAGLGPLPLTYLMIYAPRCVDELGVIGQLLKASIAYMRQ